MRPSFLLLSVATGIRIMYCKDDCLRDYQQEMKTRLFAHRYGKDASAGRHSEGVLVWFRHPGMDCGTSQGAGGADRGNGCPIRDEEGGRKCESDVHPVVITKSEGYGRATGFDRY